MATRNQSAITNNLRMPAQLFLTPNGEGSSSAKVKIVARTGDPIDNPWWGRMVHDFAGMHVANRIPLDYAHDCQTSIGYLNKFDTSTNDLVCSGAIVPFNDDEGAEVIHKISEGVPYQASIEWDDEYEMEMIPENYSAEVNGQTIDGPVMVVRDWTLIAVAVCKFGMDDNTSTELQMAKAKEAKQKNNVEKTFITITTNKSGREIMNKNKLAVETKDEPKVEAVVKVDEKKEVLTKVEAEKPAVETQVVAEVETKDELKVEAKVNPEVEADVQQLSKPTVEATVDDPRAEAKKFMLTFGEVNGAKYFALGASFDEAMQQHLKFQQSQIEELQKKLANVDRGSKEPVSFKENSSLVEEKKTFQDMFKLK